LCPRNDLPSGVDLFARPAWTMTYNMSGILATQFGRHYTDDILKVVVNVRPVAPGVELVRSRTRATYRPWARRCGQRYCLVHPKPRFDELDDQRLCADLFVAHPGAPFRWFGSVGYVVFWSARAPQ